MSNLFASAASRFSELRNTSGASTVVYRRGVDEVTTTATVGKIAGDLADLEGFVVEGEQIDFIVRRIDLDFGAGVVTPIAGDEIDLDNGIKVATYVVLPDATDACYRRCDEFGYDLRVHTERRDEVSS